MLDILDTCFLRSWHSLLHIFTFDFNFEVAVVELDSQKLFANVAVVKSHYVDVAATCADAGNDVSLFKITTTAA